MDGFNLFQNFTFIYSPEGTGIDCHRTWEALYLNTIPIMKRNHLFRDLFDVTYGTYIFYWQSFFIPKSNALLARPSLKM